MNFPTEWIGVDERLPKAHTYVITACRLEDEPLNPDHPYVYGIGKVNSAGVWCSGLRDGFNVCYWHRLDPAPIPLTLEQKIKQQRDSVIALLHQFGDHKYFCSKDANKCDCGFANAIRYAVMLQSNREYHD